MNVCFFGSFDPEYPRNRILIDGLKKNGVKVFPCNSKVGFFLLRYVELVQQYWPIRNKVQIIFVAFVGQLNVPIAWILAKLTGKRLVFDMFYSMYNTYVFDRQSTEPNSFRARSYWWIDKIAASLAEVVTVDTQSHADYYIRTFHLARKKLHRIFVGGDETLFKPRTKKPHKKVKILFHGVFTRLHGAEYFVKAAKFLEKEKNVEFLLIGSSTNYTLPITLYNQLKPKHMTYLPSISLEKLASVIAESDVSVGHLGTTEKARAVITNKMFQALFCKTVVIAGECSANHELFTDRKDALFVAMGDEKELARKVLLLVRDNTLRKKISENGYILAQRKLTNKELGKELLTILEELVGT